MPMQTRRRFLATLSLAGAAGILHPIPARAAEGRLETTAVRLPKTSSICSAPQFVAEALLRAEGITDIRYVDTASSEVAATIARGKADFGLNYGASLIRNIDAGEAVTVVGGVHIGCFEVFGSEAVRSIADLKGKSVGIPALGSPQHLFLAVIAAQVGVDPNKDVNWVVSPSVKPMQLFVDRKIDAFLGFPPEPQELRARQIGHVILNSALDRPWSQYFCCMLAGNPDYVRNHPVATKRVVRAVLKAADLCATDPAGSARRLVDGGFTPRYDYALQTLKDLPYDKWREYDPEDTMRFYALRLRDTGLIKSTPQKIIGDNTDWRFFNELRRELKV